MSKLTKEEVISALESVLASKQGSAVTIEQKGSWYKIDGGKSLRFSELETMLGELNGGTASAEVAEPKTKPAAKPKAEVKTEVKKGPAKKASTKAVKTANSQGGKTPKELWREKLAGKGQLPRGF